MFFFSFSLLRTHTAYCKHEATSCLIYLSTSTGVRTGCHYLFNRLVCLSVCHPVTFVVFTYCESCTRPIYTNPGYMEVGKYELTWDVFRRAVSRWSRSPGCCEFRRVFSVGRIFFSFFFFFERARPAASMRPPCLIYLATSNYATLSRNVIMPLWFKCYY